MTTDDMGSKILFQYLKDLYYNNQIYTYAGDILVAMRPSKTLSIYNKTVMEGYSQWTNESLKLNHVFSVGQSVYEAMLLEPDVESAGQCILLRGDSGSGKTESCKHLMKFWSNMYCNNETLRNKLLNLFPVLEAFGNASTRTNLNSSRFAMALTLCFNANFVTGLKLTHFLLDQWRVTYQFKSELNFNVLYYACASHKTDAAPNREYKLLKNKRPETDEVLSGKYGQLLNSMKIVGFSEKELTDVDLLLKFILNLGNLTFNRSKLNEVTLDDESKQILYSHAELLGFDGEELEQNLYTKHVRVNASEAAKLYTRDEAEDFLDLLIRSLYNGLFSWIIRRINDMLAPQSNKTDSNSTPIIANNRYIDVLDFYSLECQQINSLEELLMNTSAELAHYMTIQNYNQIPKEVYEMEKLVWTEKHLPNNDHFMNLFHGTDGFFEVLENEIAKDEAFMNNLIEKDQKVNQVHYDAKKPGIFSIKHYDGKAVEYDVRGWGCKNGGWLSRGVLNIFKNAENYTMSLLFREHDGSNLSAAAAAAAVQPGIPRPAERKKKKVPTATLR